MTGLEPGVMGIQLYWDELEAGSVVVCLGLRSMGSACHRGLKPVTTGSSMETEYAGPGLVPEAMGSVFILAL